MEFNLDLLPEGDSGNAFHLLNEGDERFRQTLAQTLPGRSPLTVKVTLVELHHGRVMYERRRDYATLLVFQIRFQSQLQRQRYKSASVTLEFFDSDSGSPSSNSKRDPHVISIAPDRVHWLHKTSRERTTTHGASLGIRAGPEIAGAEGTVHWEAEETKPVNFKATVTGISSHSKRRYGKENAVTWTMEESSDGADGIPSFLQAAVLLRRNHDGEFLAKLRVRSKVDPRTAMKRLLPFSTGDEDKVIDPIIITPGQTQLQSNAVTGIGETDLDSMEKLPLSSYFRVNLSEQDHLTPSVAPLMEPDEDVEEPRQSQPASKESLPEALSVPTQPNVPDPTFQCTLEEIAKNAAEAAKQAAFAALEASKAAKAAEMASVAAAEAAQLAAHAAERAAHAQ